MARMLFTSESVTEGHPDKICDAISDAVLDAIIADDPGCRVACETAVKTGFVLIAGEITTKTYVSLPEVVRNTVREIGYTHSSMGFDADTCGVLSAVEAQSPDIAQGVDGRGVYGDEQGAGDQGMMFGFACDQTDELMPLPIVLAHRLTQRLAAVRKDGTLPWLRPDGKSQVTVRYDGEKIEGVDAVVVSTQHAEEVEYDTLKDAILESVVKPVIPQNLVSNDTKFFINPTGRFVVGGPQGDSGLTGRKIIVDTYGGWGRHGGGAFSGKDPSKVDRSAAYYARYIAKNIVAAKLARSAEVQLAYAIGVAEPVSIFVNTFGSGVVDEDKLSAAVREVFDCRPAALIRELDLLKPIYRRTSAYGHFGREEEDFSWERKDRAEALSAACKEAACKEAACKEKSAPPPARRRPPRAAVGQSPPRAASGHMSPSS